MTIGRKIRELRLQKGWILADLAKQSGVALSSLSRMETGKMTGTLGSHIAVARVLGVRLSELYMELDPLESFIEHRTKELHPEKILLGKGAGLAILVSGSLRKKMLPALLGLQPGKSTPREQAPMGTETFIYLLKGQAEATVGKEKILLNAGDSLYFQAALAHQLKNPGPGGALALKISSPPNI